MHHTGTVTDIVEIRNVFGGPTREVVEGMVAYSVAGVKDHFVDVGMFTDIITYTEKRGFSIILC